LQAEESARYVAALFTAGQVPQQRALLHSTSRRARETAAKLPGHLPNLEIWNADLLRETDPAKNPMRAEAVFDKLFVAPPAGAADTLIIVAHNNMILYLLMRAAGIPMERAAQAWRLFTLRHASLTRVDIAPSGLKQVISVGAAGHISHATVTWNNITGEDMSAWKGGMPERKKFSGRMVVLVRQAHSGVDYGEKQRRAVAPHIKGLSDYMMSSHVTVACTPEAQHTANAIAKEFRTHPQVMPGSITEQPEAAFLQFFCPPSDHSRDAIVMVAEDVPVLYWLLRALMLGPEDAKVASASYKIGHACYSLINVRSDGSMRVVAVGD
jgi:broad specificity phosphatase PhoE